MWFLAYLFVFYALVVGKFAGFHPLPWWVVLAPAWVPALAAIVVITVVCMTKERGEK